MFKCLKCSTQNPDGAKYCKECGNEIWYYQPIQKLPISKITVEILCNNISRSIEQYKISDLTHEVFKIVLLKHISGPIGWPLQFKQMYFKNCDLYYMFQEFQTMVSIGYHLAITIEKTTGKIIDIPIEIINQLKIDDSAEWICNFSYELNSKGIEIIENLFLKNDFLKIYFNNIFPISDNIIAEAILAYTERSYNTFIANKQLNNKFNLSEYDQNMIFSVLKSHISWGVWIRFVERIVEIYREILH